MSDINKYLFKIKIEEKNQLEYVVSFIDYPNIIGSGNTIKAAIEEARDNLKVYLEYDGKEGNKIIEPKYSDWKMFTNIIGVWQERYMANILEEYKSIIDRNDKISKRYHCLEDEINKNKYNPGIRMSLEKKSMVDDLILLVKQRVIDIDDLFVFSDELRQEVQSRL